MSATTPDFMAAPFSRIEHAEGISRSRMLSICLRTSTGNVKQKEKRHVGDFCSVDTRRSHHFASDSVYFAGRKIPRGIGQNVGIARRCVTCNAIATEKSTLRKGQLTNIRAVTIDSAAGETADLKFFTRNSMCHMNGDFQWTLKNRTRRGIRRINVSYEIIYQRRRLFSSVFWPKYWGAIFFCHSPAFKRFLEWMHLFRANQSFGSISDFFASVGARFYLTFNRTSHTFQLADPIACI